LGDAWAHRDPCPWKSHKLANIIRRSFFVATANA
jgi:hypothetical protein